MVTREKHKENILLVKNGIFPITRDKENQILDDNKVPGQIISYGKYIGKPALFIRLTFCNLRCAWNINNQGHLCPVKHSSYYPEEEVYLITDLVEIIRNNLYNGIKHLVICGGEPLVQIKELKTLLFLIRKKKLDVHIILETNGTIYDNEVMDYIDTISISPKLKTTIPFKDNVNGTEFEYNERWVLKHDFLRNKIRILQFFIDSCFEIPTNSNSKRRSDKDFQFIFNVQNLSDINEIKNEILNHLMKTQNTDIFIIPVETKDVDEQKKIQKIAQTHAVKNNWNYNFLNLI